VKFINSNEVFVFATCNYGQHSLVMSVEGASLIPGKQSVLPIIRNLTFLSDLSTN
jgi:hypothetical protein